MNSAQDIIDCSDEALTAQEIADINISRVCKGEIKANPNKASTFNKSVRRFASNYGLNMVCVEQ